MHVMLLISSLLSQGAIRLRLPALNRDLETLSNSTEADPFSKFGDSSSDGRADRASSLEALDDFALRSLHLILCAMSNVILVAIENTFYREHML